MSLLNLIQDLQGCWCQRSQHSCKLKEAILLRDIKALIFYATKIMDYMVSSIWDWDSRLSWLATIFNLFCQAIISFPPPHYNSVPFS